MSPLVRLGPRRALVGAAVLVTVSLGIVWHATSATYGQAHPGYSTTTLTHNWYTGDLDLTPTYMPGYFIEGDPADGARGFESEVRLVLVPALGVLLWTIARPSATARRAARFGAYGLLVCSLLAVSARYVVPTMVSATAAGLILWALEQPAGSGSADRPGPEGPPTATAF